ncbi:hypothetical protein, partial [Stenotrophomonas sp. 3diitr2024]|uniref:hypothetical protein n=1 Tax=Stenotrophomonas sp. 3diitr2024 TaxID=3345115 RepID=UPI0035CB5C42
MSSTTAPIERPRISACIIAFNEAGRIGDCLASLAFCDEIRKDGIRLDTFLPGLMLAPPVRVPGTAVFLTADPTVAPHALMHN